MQGPEATVVCHDEEHFQSTLAASLSRGTTKSETAAGEDVAAMLEALRAAPARAELERGDDAVARAWVFFFCNAPVSECVRPSYSLGNAGTHLSGFVDCSVGAETRVPYRLSGASARDEPKRTRSAITVSYALHWRGSAPDGPLPRQRRVFLAVWRSLFLGNAAAWWRPVRVQPGTCIESIPHRGSLMAPPMDRPQGAG
jgi:hypothetical protein